MKTPKQKIIVFIAGAFVTNNVWQDWQHAFKNQGFKIYAPWWPHKDAPAEVLLKKHPDADLGSLGLKELIHFFEQYLAAMPARPTVIAEGLAAVVIKALMGRNIIHGAVLINPWPCKRHLPSLPLLANFFPMVVSTQFQTSYLMPSGTWQKLMAFGRMFPTSLDAYRVPESRRLIRDAMLGYGLRCENPTIPLLAVCTRNAFVNTHRLIQEFTKYNAASPLAEIKIFDQLGPPALGYKPEEELVDCILGWVIRIHQEI